MGEGTTWNPKRVQERMKWKQYCYYYNKRSCSGFNRVKWTRDRNGGAERGTLVAGVNGRTEVGWLRKSNRREKFWCRLDLRVFRVVERRAIIGSEVAPIQLK